MPDAPASLPRGDADEAEPPRSLAARCDAAALAGLLAIVCVQFSGVKATNFGGYDEWPILSLTARGIVDLPYANRPLELVWDLPAPLIAPHDLTAFLVLHAAYIFLSGALVFVLCGRLLPGRPLEAFSASVFSVAWAPMDFLRLNSVVTVAYSGVTCASLLAVFLFVESWARRSRVLLAAAVTLALLAARTYESAIPLLLCAPLALARIAPRRDRSFWTWGAAWEASVLACTFLILRFFLPGALGPTSGAWASTWPPSTCSGGCSVNTATTCCRS